ncbi:DUF4198 domain-containing protein [bacterium]|nr:DUF4198 domain-containing protein [bacterium]
MTFSTIRFGWTGVFVCALVFTSIALAHGVELWVEANGLTVRVEAHASDGEPVADADITAKTPEGAHIAEGKTDAKGVFSFEVEAPADLVIRLESDTHHHAKFTLSRMEFETPPATPSPTPTPPVVPPLPTPTPTAD